MVLPSPRRLAGEEAVVLPGQDPEPSHSESGLHARGQALTTIPPSIGNSSFGTPFNVTLHKQLH